MYFVFLCFYKNEINITNNKKKIVKGFQRSLYRDGLRDLVQFALSKKT